jgi:hypothetical protein
MLVETLFVAPRRPFACIPGRQRRPVSWISASGVALAAIRALEKDMIGLHKVAGPETATFHEAYTKLSQKRDKTIRVLHPLLMAVRLPGLLSWEVWGLVNMFALFDAACYTADPALLHERFGVRAQTLDEGPGQPG